MGSNDTKESLSEAESTTLLVALDRGYFEVPRRETLSGLAEELGVPDTEVSERLRRAMTKVFTEHRAMFERQLDEDDHPPPGW